MIFGHCEDIIDGSGDMAKNCRVNATNTGDTEKYFSEEWSRKSREIYHEDTRHSTRVIAFYMFYFKLFNEIVY